MLRLWRWYQNCLAVHPLKTQIISSGLIWGLGDIAAQSVTHYTAKSHPQFSINAFMMVRIFMQSTLPDPYQLMEFMKICYSMGRFYWLLLAVDEVKGLKINWKRVATTSLFGFGFVGPVGHFWYEGLDRLIRVRLKMQSNSFRFVGTKVAIDGIIFGPLDLLVFFTYMGFSTGKTTPQIKEDVKRDFLPALAVEGGIWPILQVANFRFVPVRNQLLYVNFFCLLDSCFLSWIEQQEDAPWKQWFASFLQLNEEKDQGR